MRRPGKKPWKSPFHPLKSPATVQRVMRARIDYCVSQRGITRWKGAKVMATARSKRFPGETDEYRRARNHLLQSEVKLRRQIEAVAAERRRLPLGGEVRTDYEFETMDAGGDGVSTVHLSELFTPGKRSLFVYNFMFPESVGSMTPCPSCTSIIDAVDGAARHVVQRIIFVVVAKAPIDKFRRHARNRGWRHALLLSSAENTFN